MKITNAFLLGMLIGLGIISSILIGFYFGFGLLHVDEIKLLEASYIGTALAAVASFVGVFLLFLTFKSQKKELQATQEALRLQKTDSAFFNMLTLLQELINSMTDSIIQHMQPSQITGRAYLKYALNQLHDKYFNDYGKINRRPNLETGKFNQFIPLPYNPYDEHSESEKINYGISESYEDLVSEVAHLYEDFYSEHQQNLGHYFRYVYNIIKYVLDPSNGLKAQDQNRYLNILQAQLSNDEMGLIFYNVLSNHGKNSNGESRFLRLLEDHKLLENMDRSSLVKEWHHWFFTKTMFKFLDEEEVKRKLLFQPEISRFNIPS